MKSSSFSRKINGKYYDKWISIGNTVDKKTVDELIMGDKKRGMLVVKVKPTVEEKAYGKIKFILYHRRNYNL